MGKDGWRNKLQSLLAFWTTLLGAGAFVFCSMVSIQGLAQLLPRQAFLRISAVLQMALFCLLLTVYFAQPGFSSLESLAANQNLLRWLPSYWFFGLFQESERNPAPGAAWLPRPASLDRPGTAQGRSGARVPDLLLPHPAQDRGTTRHPARPRRPALAARISGSGSFPTAIVQFSIRTLLRSRQHRVILSFYLGLAFGLAIFFAKSPGVQEGVTATDPWHQVNPEMLVASIVMMGAAVLGARVVFSLPLDLRANWIFRVTPIPGGPRQHDTRAGARCTCSPSFRFGRSPRRYSCGYGRGGRPWDIWLSSACSARFVAELCLHNFHKLPVHLLLSARKILRAHGRS